MLKAYLSSKYIEASKLTEYLEMPPDKILLSGAKILLDTDSNETAEHTLASLKLSDINFENETEEIFVTEVLTTFDQILKDEKMPNFLQKFVKITSFKVRIS